MQDDQNQPPETGTNRRPVEIDAAGDAEPTRGADATGDPPGDPAAEDRPRPEGDADGGPTDAFARPRFVVGVGASAGGLDALEQFFSNVPHNTGLAFVVVQHLAPDFRSLMDEILARQTSLRICRVEDGMLVEPETIYLIPPRKNMIISNGRLLLTEQDSAQGLHLPIDMFFRSLAQDLGARAVGVIMSGTGSDGSRGITSIARAGGLTLVQEIETAKFDGMPRAALATNDVTATAKPEAMPRVMLRLLDDPESAGDATDVVDPLDSAHHTIFELLQVRYGIDFQYYKPSTVDRRIERRISITRCRDVDDYVTLLRATPSEVNSLYQDLLIGVTQFFRDRRAFEVLSERVVPQLFEAGQERHESIRVWVPGCATGEEPYSIAIMLQEYARQHEIDIEIKVFATDVHRESLEFAAHGTYGEEQISGIDPNLVRRYFTTDGRRYRISNDIRKMVIFAPQNLITDPPFTRLDLITCRNALIYFSPEVQRKILSLFHFAIRSRGFLFLGPSETVGDLAEEFEVISSEWKIFSKRRDAFLPASRTAILNPLAGSSQRLTETRRRQAFPTPAVTNDAPLIWAYESLLAHHIDTGFLVDDQRQVLHVFGGANLLLRPPSGRQSSDLLRMLPQELATAAGAALHRVTRDQVPIVYPSITVEGEDDGPPKTVRMRVDPLRHRRTDHRYFFVSIDDVERAPDDVVEIATTSAASADDDQRLADLESELQFTKEHLQATNEELETSNEELQATNEELVAANEELQSTNEELQSTNEELQSTNEELHSVNEELHTVNAEHQRKIEEMSQLTVDMENLLNSTRIGTVFLGTELTVRRFTPAIATAINLLPRDIGRHIGDLADRLEGLGDETLTTIAQRVVDTGHSSERDVNTQGGVHMELRALPYLDDRGETDGVVLTFHDVTRTRSAELKLREYAERLERVNHDLQDFAYAASHDLAAPVRQVEQLLQELERDADGGGDTGRTRELLGTATSRLRTMVDDLLQFSRVQTRGRAFEPFNASLAVQDALTFLRTELDTCNAAVTQGLLPTIHGDRLQIGQLLRHLIQNALEHAGAATPQIRITAVHRGQEWLFSVRDNGRGIASEQLDEVFKIFRHADEAAPAGDAAGTDPSDALDTTRHNAFGLAIARRIVERHGGAVWIESEVGTGTEVFFTLPLSPVAADGDGPDAGPADSGAGAPTDTDSDADAPAAP